MSQWIIAQWYLKKHSRFCRGRIQCFSSYDQILHQAPFSVILFEVMQINEQVVSLRKKCPDKTFSRTTMVPLALGSSRIFISKKVEFTAWRYNLLWTAGLLPLWFVTIDYLCVFYYNIHYTLVTSGIILIL